jgi:hypothetical protein
MERASRAGTCVYFDKLNDLDTIECIKQFFTAMHQRLENVAESDELRRASDNLYAPLDGFVGVIELLPANHYNAFDTPSARS